MNEEVRRYLQPREPAEERMAAQAVFNRIDEDGYDIPMQAVNRFLFATRLLQSENGQNLSVLIDAFRNFWTRLEAAMQQRVEEEGSFGEPTAQALAVARPHAEKILGLDVPSILGVRKEIEAIRRVFGEKL